MPRDYDDDNLDDADMRLFDSGNFADATIVCGDRTWKVHKLILSSRSKWFKAAFHGNMAEAASGTIVLEEQDPDFVDDMLRFLYAKSVDISALREGKDIPLLCVELFRVADFFLISDLAATAKAELQQHLMTRIEAQDKDKKAMPETLTEVLRAIRSAYKDNSTVPLRQMLLTFLCMRKDRYLQARDTLALTDELPEVGKDLMKTCLSVHLTTNEPNELELPRALPVLEAVCEASAAYTAGGPSRISALYGVKHFNTPCMLQPEPNDSWPTGSLFKVVDSRTNMELRDISYIAPSPRFVWRIGSNRESSILQVSRRTKSYQLEMIHIRFVCPADAKHFLDRYRKGTFALEEVNKGILQLEQELDRGHDQLFARR